MVQVRLVSAHKSQQYYFGSWKEDPAGERALKDPNFGWLARRDAIYAEIDNIRLDLATNANDFTLGELMARFLAHKRDQVKTSVLSLRTLGDCIVEIGNFAGFQKPGILVSSVKPEHFSSQSACSLKSESWGVMRESACAHTSTHSCKRFGEWLMHDAGSLQARDQHTDVEQPGTRKRVSAAEGQQYCFSRHKVSRVL